MGTKEKKLRWISIRWFKRYQILFDTNVSEEAFNKAEKLGSEYVVAVKGIVRERQSKNPNMPTGDIEIEATELRVLSKSETPPIYIKDNDNVSEDLRLKYRFLDLRKPSMQNNLVLRSKVANIVRNYLSGNNFVEINSILNKAISRRSKGLFSTK